MSQTNFKHFPKEEKSHLFGNYSFIVYKKKVGKTIRKNEFPHTNIRYLSLFADTKHRQQQIRNVTIIIVMLHKLLY